MKLKCVLAVRSLGLALGCAVAFASLRGQDVSEGGGGAMKRLPEPSVKGAMTVEEAIKARRSWREFTGEPLDEKTLAQLLWAAQGVTLPERGFRAAPSAGATYPLETYVATAEGVFRYIPASHSLEQVAQGDRRAQLASAAMDQACVRHAGAVIAFAAVPERTTLRYGQRGVMFIHMEAGHAAQNVQLQAVALGLGSVPAGAFDEKAAGAALGIRAGETLLYLVPVGHMKK